MAFAHPFLLLSFTIFFHLPATHSIEAGNVGFSVEIIHRDSPKSPFYNPSETLSDRVAKAVQRSNARVNYFHSIINLSSKSSKNIQSNVIPVTGGYLMTLFIGTPVVKLYAYADTGSGFIWTQCKPCVECFDQRDPLFDPRKSSTYRNLPCKSKSCAKLPLKSCGSKGECQYSYSYLDGSFSNGTVATETLTFDSASGSKVKVPNMVIGCGHTNGEIIGNNSDGTVGLTADPTSLISQLGPSIDGKFSYCLVPVDTTSTSLLNFGHNAIVSGPGVVSTPLFAKSPYYILNLEYIIVGGQKIQVTAFQKPGNIIIDSGTTLTYLDNSTYNSVLSIVKGMIKSPRVKAPAGTFDLCFKNSSRNKLPYMKFGFTNAELLLPPTNLFLLQSDNVLCLAMAAADGIPFFGNVAQQNFKVGFDVKKMTVSFLPADCTKH